MNSTDSCNLFMLLSHFHRLVEKIRKNFRTLFRKSTAEKYTEHEHPNFARPENANPARIAYLARRKSIVCRYHIDISEWREWVHRRQGHIDRHAVSGIEWRQRSAMAWCPALG